MWRKFAIPGELISYIPVGSKWGLTVSTDRFEDGEQQFLVKWSNYSEDENSEN